MKAAWRTSTIVGGFSSATAIWAMIVEQGSKSRQTSAHDASSRFDRAPVICRCVRIYFDAISSLLSAGQSGRSVLH